MGLALACRIQFERINPESETSEDRTKATSKDINLRQSSAKNNDFEMTNKMLRFETRSNPPFISPPPFLAASHPHYALHRQMRPGFFDQCFFVVPTLSTNPQDSYYVVTSVVTCHRLLWQPGASLVVICCLNLGLQQAKSISLAVFRCVLASL